MKAYSRGLKAAKGRVVNPDLRACVMSRQWRQNGACAGAALWGSAAALVKAS